MGGQLKEKAEQKYLVEFDTVSDAETARDKLMMAGYTVWQSGRSDRLIIPKRAYGLLRKVGISSRFIEETA